MTRLSDLATGGTSDVDYREADDLSRRFAAENRARLSSTEPKPTAWNDRAVYAAAYNSTALVPTDGREEGVQTMIGRVWAEARSIVHSGGSGSVDVTLIATQNGVRAGVETPVGTTLTSGSIRFWLQDPVSKRWGLGGVEETLAAGVRRVWSTDQFTTVGGR